MAFRGVLQNLSDLLQFLVHAKKTGILRVHHEDDTKFLAFHEGQLNYAVHHRPVPRLSELFHGHVSTTTESGEEGWGDVVSRALERKRKFQLEKLETGAIATNLDDARDSYQQLKSLNALSEPTIRLGEYLVATEQITQRQFERALEVQVASKKPLGEILIDQDAISREDLQGSVEELQVLRGDFGPLYPLQMQLCHYGVDIAEFTGSLSEHETTGRPLWDILVNSERVTDEEMREAVEEVLINELCDLTLWSDDAYFHFHENMFVENIISASGFPTVHNGAFDLQSLLLQAHSRIDDLRRDGLRDISLATIFVPAEDAPEMEIDNHLYAIIDSLDGRRPLREVRRALPGNRFFHLQLFSQFLDEGLVRPLTRVAAFDHGQESARENRTEEALTLFEHALGAPGDSPSNTRIRAAIQEVRGPEPSAAPEHNIPLPDTLVPLSDTVSSDFSPLSRLNQISRKTKFSFETILIRSGLGRHLWAIHNRVVEPVIRPLAPAFTRPRTNALISVSLVLLVVVLSLWIRNTIEEIPTSSADMPRPDQFAGLRAERATRHAPAPLDVAPTLSGDRIYYAGRDGSLRCERFTSEGGLETRWDVRIGEYGDILSQPVVAGDTVFVTNVRGAVHAVTLDGRPRWEHKFPRVEAMAPVCLYGAGNELVAIAVVARHQVHVLSPVDGSVLRTVETGNRIVARPVGDGTALFVGSADNHLYAESWSRDETRWNHEESDDITDLTWIDGLLVFATRSGRLAARDGETGEELWTREYDRESIRTVDALESERLCVQLPRGHTEILMASTGELVSEIIPDADLNVVSAQLHGDRLLAIQTNGHVAEIDAAGALRWRSRESLGKVSGLASGDDFVAVTSRDGRLVVFSTDFMPDNGGPSQ